MLVRKPVINLYGITNNYICDISLIYDISLKMNFNWMRKKNIKIIILKVTLMRKAQLKEMLVCCHSSLK